MSCHSIGFRFVEKLIGKVEGVKLGPFLPNSGLIWNDLIGPEFLHLLTSFSNDNGSSEQVDSAAVEPPGRLQTPSLTMHKTLPLSPFFSFLCICICICICTSTFPLLYLYLYQPQPPGRLQTPSLTMHRPETFPPSPLLFLYLYLYLYVYLYLASISSPFPVFV